MGHRDKTEITPEIYNFMVQHSVREPEVCKQLREKTVDMEGGHLMTSPEQMQAISMFLKVMQPKKCLEIGVFTGYSAIWTALNLPKNAQLIALERFPYYTDIAKEYFEKAGVADVIDYRLCHARETMEMWVKDSAQKESFDYIYLDANKRDYPKYYELGIQLLKTGGVMVLDNMFCFGEVLEHGSVRGIGDIIRELNEAIHKDERVEICMLPMGDGLTFVRKL